jgi:glyoxylase-like metal-dependent hydrolase (beta-lactamase superfamily II)
VGAPENEKLDIAMVFWLIQGEGRKILLDAGANVKALDRMVSLAGAPERVVPGHDPLIFKRFPAKGRIAKIRRKHDKQAKLSLFFKDFQQPRCRVTGNLEFNQMPVIRPI